MPNNKTNSETSRIETTCQMCLIRTLTDPDLHARLKEAEKNARKKNNFYRSQSKSFSSVTSSNSSIPRTPNHTPSSSYASVKFFFSSSSTSFCSLSSSSIARVDNYEDNYGAHRRYTF